VRRSPTRVDNRRVDDRRADAQRWQDKRGKAALTDWHVPVFVAYIVVVVAVIMGMYHAHGWAAGLITFAALFAAKVIVKRLWKRRGGAPPAL
jgi:hypothetical protein